MPEGGRILDAEAGFKLAAAVGSAVFAVLILAGGPRKAPNQFLAFFLLLIAGNQAAEAGIGAGIGGPLAAGNPLRHAAIVFAALDPFVLYYFASIYPRRNALNESRRVALVLAAALGTMLLALATGGGQIGVAGLLLSVPLTLFTAGTYTVVLLSAVDQLRADPASERLRLLYPALCVAAIPLWSQVGYDLIRAVSYWTAADLWWVPVALLALCSLVISAAPLLLLARAGGREAPRQLRRTVAAGAVAGGFVAALRMAPSVLVSFVDVPIAVSATLGGGNAALRWLVFGALVSVAVLRHDMLGMSLAQRRRAARALVALAFLGGALTAIAVVNESGSGPILLSPTEGLILLIALLASQSVRGLVDRVGARLYGVPMPGDPGAAAEAYRAAVLQAVEEGRTPTTDPALGRLREELGLDRRTAGVLERMAEASTSGPLVAGQTLGGRYRVERLLGRGGAGRAFLAKDELLQRQVVLKDLPQEGDAGVDRALAEARAASALQHPNVVTIYDVVRRTGSTVLVGEFVPGGSLADRLASKPVDPAEALRIADGVLAALEAVHANGIVHRDVKPANVLLAPDGTPKLGDFGVARVRRGLTANFDERDAFAGTPEFMAPEQRRGAIATPATDIYAVGLLLREMLPSMPRALAPLVDRATAEDPAVRWPSAAAMRAALAGAGANVTRGTSAGSGRRR